MRAALDSLSVLAYGILSTGPREALPLSSLPRPLSPLKGRRREACSAGPPAGMGTSEEKSEQFQAIYGGLHVHTDGHRKDHPTAIGDYSSSCCLSGGARVAGEPLTR